MDRIIRFGLIGTGRIAQSYAEAFAATPGVTLTAVADIREGAAQVFAARSNSRAYGSYRELLAHEDLDAVIVSTPPATHGEICLAAIDAGVAVLCEKPVSIDVPTARAIRDAARRHNVLFTMASKFRHVDDLVRAKSIVTSGILGDIVLFENTFMSRVDMSGRWNADPALSGGGVLIDNGTHSVDIMRFFLGPLAEIHVVEGIRTQGLPVEETVQIQVRSEMGTIGHIDLSWSLNKEADYYVAIYGSHGTLRVGWKESTYKQAGSKDWIVFGKGYDKVQAFGRQLENFSRALLGREQLIITPEDAIASVEAIQAGYAALRQSGWAAVTRQLAAVV